MSHRVRSQTIVTSFDIVFNILSQAWPIVFPSNQLSCLFNAKMSYKRIIVVMTYHLKADNLWDI